jgi:hypothetical protein
MMYARVAKTRRYDITRVSRPGVSSLHFIITNVKHTSETDPKNFEATFFKLHTSHTESHVS